MSRSAPEEEAVHRGVRWRRDEGGAIGFYDEDGGRWIPWARGADAPPLPPGWAGMGSGRRPGWRSRWRLIPVLFTVVVVVIAVVQVFKPGGNPVNTEANKTAGLLGKCLAQHGTSGGHPRYSATPVDCSSSSASVKVVKVLSSSPGSALCPGSTTGMEIPYAGVAYPHILCLAPVTPGGG